MYFKLFTNAIIISLDNVNNIYSSMLVFGNKFVCLFEEPDPDLTLPGGYEIIDVCGQTILPGFIDSHIHLMEWGRTLDRIDLSNSQSIDKIRDLLSVYCKQNVFKDFIIGQGWNQNLWNPPILPESNRILDKVESERPVILYSRCTHLAWVNSAALRFANIHRSTPNPDGGEIVKNKDGEPTGLLKENALNLLTNISNKRTKLELIDIFQSALKLAWTNGITGAHCVEAIEDFEFYQEIYCENNIDFNILFYLPGKFLSQAESIKLSATPVGSAFRIVGFKFFADGSLGGRTAYMHEDYVDTPGNRGISTLDREEAIDVVLRATQLGMGMAVHAIGDAAISNVLNAYRVGREFEFTNRLNNKSSQYRIEHFQTCKSSDIKLAASLKVSAMMQPIHLCGDWKTADVALGVERSSSTYAFKSLINAGVNVCFGSDAPIESVSIPMSLHAAVNRQDRAGTPDGGWIPSERITIEQALRCYTNNPAKVAGDFNFRGSIEVGKIADFVVLNKNPLAVDSSELMQLEITQTWVNGKQVYSLNSD